MVCNEEDQIFVCHECVDDDFLKKEIQADGTRKTCSYCNQSRKAVELEWLGEKIYDVINRHFQLTPSEPNSFEYAMQNDRDFNYCWYRSGEELNQIIQLIAGVDEPIATEVQEVISNISDCDPYGDDVSYDPDPHYEEISPNGYEHRSSWDFFCGEVKHRARFFNPATEIILDTLFHGISSYETIDNQPVICIAGPNTDIPEIFRARVSQSNELLEQILEEPTKELAAPPAKLAKHGRMNPAGIAVFYGAATSKTCIAEVRPPVGCNVVVGRFEIVRELRLLDLNMLSKIYVTGSHFDPSYMHRCEQIAFLQDLVVELTKPIMPDEEAFEYLPTQIVAEYLAEKIDPRLDGIIFNSSQTDDSGQNIILFHDSCYVEPYILPKGSEVHVHQRSWGVTDEDEHDDISINELISDTQPLTTKETIFSYIDCQEDLHDERNVTLRLNVDSDVNVLKIEAATYKSRKRSLFRSKSAANLNAEFL